jgi:RNA polymerase sigma-70 factor, ECF subfamily
VTSDDRILSNPETWPDRYGDYLFRCAILRVRDKDLAEEIVQDTFLAALKARERFAGQSTERSWLVGIMKHKVVDQFRKNCREQVCDDPEAIGHEIDHDGSFDDSGHWKLDQTAPLDWPDNPAGILERKQFWDILKRCLGELPPRMAQVFSLREVDELDTEEICEAMNISSSNLWVLLHRARKHLRQCLEVNQFGRSAV